ncbi:MAG: hypothetical protein AB2722_10885 [Candidatus Thiodiazotropha sp.]
MSEAHLLYETLQTIGENCSLIAKDLDNFENDLVSENDFIEIPPKLRAILTEACENLSHLVDLISFPESLVKKQDILGQLVKDYSGGSIIEKDEKFKREIETLERYILTRIGLEEDYVNTVVNNVIELLDEGSTFDHEDALSVRKNLKFITRVICAIANPENEITNTLPISILRETASGLKDVSVIAIDLSLLFGDGGLVTYVTTANSVRSGTTSLIPKVKKLWNWFSELLTTEEARQTEEIIISDSLSTHSSNKDSYELSQPKHRVFRKYIRKKGLYRRGPQ